jgi:hypothetical protein
LLSFFRTMKQRPVYHHHQLTHICRKLAVPMAADPAIPMGVIKWLETSVK